MLTNKSEGERSIRAFDGQTAVAMIALAVRR